MIFVQPELAPKLAIRHEPIADRPSQKADQAAVKYRSEKSQVLKPFGRRRYERIMRRKERARLQTRRDPFDAGLLDDRSNDEDDLAADE